eukprot:66987-Chlamydomonas_euryale.AAC.2
MTTWRPAASPSLTLTKRLSPSRTCTAAAATHTHIHTRDPFAGQVKSKHMGPHGTFLKARTRIQCIRVHCAYTVFDGWYMDTLYIHCS